MANTYTWIINQLDAKIKEDDLDNVIYNIHWSFIAEDDSDPKISISSIGTTSVFFDKEKPFIQYKDLKKEDVVSWLHNKLDVDKMKQSLSEAIELQKNPIDEFLKPDWDNPLNN